MNKRIKELAHKAGCYQETDHDGKLFWAMPEDSWEKFAQLIVKECADNAENIVGDLSTYVNPQYVSRAIKKPFGVG